MINRLSGRFLSKFATEKQQEAMDKLANSDYDPDIDKLKGKHKTKEFEGDFDNFKESALADVFEGKELKALFNLIDQDGDGEINKDEIRDLARLGKSGSKNKIDNSDLKALLKTASKLAETEREDDEDDEDFDDLGEIVEITKKYDDDGELISITKTDEDDNTVKIRYSDGKKVKTIKDNADGSREVIKYDKKGRKKSSVFTDVDGTKTITTYKKGKKYKEKVVDEDGNIIKITTYQQNFFYDYSIWEK